MNFNLTLAYKGSRDYIQGADILHESITTLMPRFPSGLAQIDLTIHRMTDKNLRLSLHRAEEGIASIMTDRVATLRFMANTVAWAAYLNEETSKPLVRQEYDESAITTLCRYENETRVIALSGNPKSNTIETIVAMTKALHLRLYPLKDAQWLFVRWESDGWSMAQQLDGIQIQIVQALGSRLTKSEVTLGARVLGHIFFSTRKFNDRHL